MSEVLSFNNLRNHKNAVIATFLSATALSGCGDSKVIYDKPVRVPHNAVYLGMNENGGDLAAGMSFEVDKRDAQYVECGHWKLDVPSGSDAADSPIKEIKLLNNGKAQITCHGADTDHPVEHFDSKVHG